MFHRESGYYNTTYQADMGLYQIPIARWSVIFLVLFFFVFVPLTFTDYLLANLNLIGIAIVGALGLNILLGYTGQISIGHAAFMSVGAYTAANFAVHFDLPFWITLPMGGLMAAFIGIIVGFPSLRIKGLYLAIATLAAQFIIEWVINHVPAISGGFQASIEVPKPSRVVHSLDFWDVTFPPIRRITTKPFLPADARDPISLCISLNRGALTLTSARSIHPSWS